MRKLKNLLPTQLAAKEALDSIKKTNLQPEPYLVHYYNMDKNGDIEKECYAFCWVALADNDQTKVFLHPFAEDVNLDAEFEEVDLLKLDAPMCFICNQGAFRLTKDAAFGILFSRVDAITNLSVAKDFARCYGLNPDNLVLCSQVVAGRMQNLIWLDYTDQGSTYIPVWPQNNNLVGQKWYGERLAVGSKIELNGCYYEVCKCFGDVYVKQLSRSMWGVPRLLS